MGMMVMVMPSATLSPLLNLGKCLLRTGRDCRTEGLGSASEIPA